MATIIRARKTEWGRVKTLKSVLKGRPPIIARFAAAADPRDGFPAQKSHREKAHRHHPPPSSVLSRAPFKEAIRPSVRPFAWRAALEATALCACVRLRPRSLARSVHAPGEMDRRVESIVDRNTRGGVHFSTFVGGSGRHTLAVSSIFRVFR